MCIEVIVYNVIVVFLRHSVQLTDRDMFEDNTFEAKASTSMNIQT